MPGQGISGVQGSGFGAVGFRGLAFRGLGFRVLERRPPPQPKICNKKKNAGYSRCKLYVDLTFPKDPLLLSSSDIQQHHIAHR